MYCFGFFLHSFAVYVFASPANVQSCVCSSASELTLQTTDKMTTNTPQCIITRQHYTDIIMSLMASQITSLTIVYSPVCSGTDQRKRQSSASLAFVRGIHRGPVNSPHKRPVTRKKFPFDDVIMHNVKQCAYVYILRVITNDVPVTYVRQAIDHRLRFCVWNTSKQLQFWWWIELVRDLRLVMEDMNVKGHFFVLERY